MGTSGRAHELQRLRAHVLERRAVLVVGPVGAGRSHLLDALAAQLADAGTDHQLVRGPEALVVEEPMSIQLDGVLIATTMRTPGHDFELAVGFCHSEGLLAGAPVRQVKYCVPAADGAPTAARPRAVDTEFWNHVVGNHDVCASRGSDIGNRQNPRQMFTRQAYATFFEDTDLRNRRVEDGNQRGRGRCTR